MKTLMLFLLPFTGFSQCPEDLFKHAVPINTPTEVQMGKGQAIVVLVFERSDTTKVETWVITKKGSTTPIPTPVTPIKIEAESATSIVKASAVGTVIGNVLPGAIISYPAVNLTGRTKVRFRYSRGYTGSGVFIFKVGATSHTFNFPTTGGWATYAEIEFNFSGTGVIQLESSTIGPANLDFFEIR